jgi:hypothetical protein
MAKPTIQDAIDALNEVAGQVMLLGVDKVAEQAGLKPRLVRKFALDVMASKNADIRKISEAVRVLQKL